MITHKQKSKGGEFTVHTPQGNTIVEYTLSNSIGSVLCLRCCIITGEAKYASSILSSLVEKYTPSVLVTETHIREVLYQKRISGMNRHETQNKTSLYFSVEENKDLISRVWKNSLTMNCIEDSKDDMVFLKIIREETKPFEFLSIKEEYDYMRREHCKSTVVKLLEIAELFSLDESFCYIIKMLKNKIQKDTQFYQSTDENVLQCTEELVIPAIIRLGSTHSFPIKLLESLGESIANYSLAKEEFLTKFRFEK